MVRVTIETDFTVGQSTIKDGECLSDVLEAVNGAIKACGYYPKGTLDYQEEENG